MGRSAKKILFSLLLLPALASASARMQLHPVTDIDMASVACGCEFRSTFDKWGPKSSAGTGTLILLDVNGDPPTAHINLGSGDITLQPKTELSFPLYECTAKEKFRSVWVLDNLELKIISRVSDAGYEACRFSGIATISDEGSQRLAEAITGSCGC